MWACDYSVCGFTVFSRYIFKSYLMSVPKIVEITHAINYITDFPRDDCARFICTKVSPVQHDLDELLIWAHDMVVWYWSASINWQLSINYNLDGQYQRCTYGNSIALSFFKVCDLLYGNMYLSTDSQLTTKIFDIDGLPNVLSYGVLFMCLWCTGTLLTVSVGVKQKV